MLGLTTLKDSVAALQPSSPSSYANTVTSAETANTLMNVF